MQNKKCEIDKSINADIPFKRSIVYELLSYAFAEPSVDFMNFLRDGELLIYIKDALNAHPYRNDLYIHHLEKASEDAKVIKIDELILEYEKLISPEMNFLYECNYHLPLSTSEEMGDVAGFYRAFSLDFNGDRPDHISMELEFMRLLTMKEAKTFMDKDMENAEICISAQKEFLSSHLGRWTPLFSHILDGVSVYGEFGRFLSKWIDAECRYLSVKPDGIFYTYTDHIYRENYDYCIKEAMHEGI